MACGVAAGLRPPGPARRRRMAENAGHMRAHVPAAAFKLADFGIDHPGLAGKSRPRVGGQDHPGLASKSRIGGQGHPRAVMSPGPPAPHPAAGSGLPLLYAGGQPPRPSSWCHSTRAHMRCHFRQC